AAPAHGVLRGLQRLAEHLAAVDLVGADVLARSAEQVFLEALERKVIDQFLEDGSHACDGRGRGAWYHRDPSWQRRGKRMRRADRSLLDPCVSPSLAP